MVSIKKEDLGNKIVNEEFMYECKLLVKCIGWSILYPDRLEHHLQNVVAMSLAVKTK